MLMIVTGIMKLCKVFFEISFKFDFFLEIACYFAKMSQKCVDNFYFSRQNSLMKNKEFVLLPSLRIVFYRISTLFSPLK